MHSLGTLVCFFFFKHKTAYEMRISDWSSDVCSSDLECGRGRQQHADRQRSHPVQRRHLQPVRQRHADEREQQAEQCGAVFEQHRERARIIAFARRLQIATMPLDAPELGQRSEEHTSELQSLMRISYAVFCLKKKKTNTITQKTQQHIT